MESRGSSENAPPASTERNDLSVSAAAAGEATAQSADEQIATDRRLTFQLSVGQQSTSSSSAAASAPSDALATTSGSSFGSSEQQQVRPRRPHKQYPLHKLLNHLEAESSDELALVKAAAVMRVRLLKRMPDKVTLQLPNNDLIQVGVHTIQSYCAFNCAFESTIISLPLNDSNLVARTSLFTIAL